MRIVYLAAAFLVAGTTANFLDFDTRILEETNSTTIPFAPTLACGGCVRGGNVFCLGSGNKVNKCCRTVAECAAEIADKAYTCTNTV